MSTYAYTQHVVSIESGGLCVLRSAPLHPGRVRAAGGTAGRRAAWRPTQVWHGQVCRGQQVSIVEDTKTINQCRHPPGGHFLFSASELLILRLRARILKHSVKAEKSTFQGELSFQRPECTAGLIVATIFSCLLWSPFCVNNYIYI
jgi:hypothetical protein